MVSLGSRAVQGAAGAILAAATLAVMPATAATPAVPRCVDHRVVDALHASPDSVMAIRCADLTGEGVRDVAYVKRADGDHPPGSVIEWGIVYSTGNGIQVARFTGHVRYRNLRVRGQRLLVDSPIVRPDESAYRPTGAVRTEDARWDGTQFVRRLVRIDRTPSASRG
jgi:hypothetical protein